MLVADDDTSVRETLCELLQMTGHRVVGAADGFAALEVLRDQEVDVLVLDLSMPRCDGRSVLSQLGAPPPVVIVHTAAGPPSASERQAFSRAKVFRALQKPVPPRLLISTVDEAAAQLASN